MASIGSTVWLLLGLKGRVSREVFWLGYVLVLSLQAVLVRPLFTPEEVVLSPTAELVWPLLLLLTLYSHIALAVKRLHDMGYAGFLAVALFVPLVNLVFTIWAGIVPGSGGPNAYGDIPDRPPP